MLKKFFILMFLFFSTEKQAYAYIDPRTGSIILQGLLAAIATGWVFISNIKDKIRKIFKSKKKKN